MNSFLKAMHFRHACKLFDENKKISESDLKYIVECGRMSPSSFGMEQWRFLVIKNKKLKEKLKPTCWDQNQITTCSDLILILAKKDALEPDNEYVKNMFARRGLSKEQTDAYLAKYTEFFDNMQEKLTIYAWSSKQCYIALANMMTGAAYIGIDSCPIEGFEKEKVEKLLNFDTKKYELSVIASFGYRVNKQKEHKRLTFDKIVEVIE